MKEAKPGWLHRSDSWGGQPHVDIGRSHGHSPTVVPPAGVTPTGALPIARRPGDVGFSSNLPAPYGPVLRPGETLSDFLDRRR